MVHTQAFTNTAATLLLTLLPLVLAHDNDDRAGEPVGMGAPITTHLSSSEALSAAILNSSNVLPQSYFGYPAFGGLMLAHIVFMTIAWFFVLPVGVMFSVSRSPLALVTQTFFLGLHGAGLLLGAVYNQKTPDLYPNNAHNKIGWIVTWIVVVQCTIGLIRFVVSAAKIHDVSAEEQTAFLPISTEALAQHYQIQAMRFPEQHRYSHDSGHCTASEPSRSQSISSQGDEEEQQKLREYRDECLPGPVDSGKHGWVWKARIQNVASKISATIPSRTLRVMNAVYDAIDCLSLLFGFVAIMTGAVVYGGVFRGNNVFNGLAHTIKGGIFFWYGLLTLGRWMGCFVEIGWAWNVKPASRFGSSRKASIPSAEFVESFVIFLYGLSNMFLEHLAAWGRAWSVQDLEHVSITILFFGGGLCGMLVESEWVRDLLNTTILTSPAAHSSKELINPPRTYPFSMNPFPGLVILLLGLIMSSHHQASVNSTMVHKQWGTLFVGFAVARAVTYILAYLSPPSSYLPSRPPSEIIASFCLISGGLIFMGSNKDTVAAMDHYGLHATIAFTVTMGFTSFLMAWVIIVLAIKGWATRRRNVSQTSGF